MQQIFPPELIAALSLGAVWPVTLLVNLVKPLIEKVPGFSVATPADKPAHDAAIQLVNGIVSVGVTLVLAMLGGYVQSPSQAWVMGVQVVGIMLASDFNYRGSAKSSQGGVTALTTPVSVSLDGKQIASTFVPAMQVRNSGAYGQQVTTRLTVSPAQIADALNSVVQQSATSTAQGMPNDLKRLADDEQPVTQHAIPAVTSVVIRQP